MRFKSRTLLHFVGMVCTGFMLTAVGCGGGSMLPQTPVPITVTLALSTIAVPQNGLAVIVPINITSTSETALVSVTGLPAGVQVKYAASDTNPSGTLAFTASAASEAGTYMPLVTVNSAGQTAATSFTLIVEAATM